MLNALTWTTFFICGFASTYVVVNSLKRPLRYPWINVLAFVLMAARLLLAAYPLFANLATVLYTFYPPMLADWTFYLGLVLLVVGSWVSGYGMYFTYGAWRKENPGNDDALPSPGRASSPWSCGRSPRWASPRKSCS